MQENSHPGALRDPKRLRTTEAFSFALGVLLIDLITKSILFNNAAIGTPRWFRGLIALVVHKNTGVSFDIPLPLPLIVLITIGVLGYFWNRFRHMDSPTRMQAIALGLLTGGALGNFIDRLWLGYVRDWLLLFGRSAINLADVSVLLGLLLLTIRRKPITRNA